MEKAYLGDLEVLKKRCEGIENTHMMAFGKVLMLIILNMRYERIMIDRSLEEHPYALVKKLISDAHSFLESWHSISFIENTPNALTLGKSEYLEENHKALFQQLWVNFDDEDYEQRIQRYEYRLKINGLANGWMKGYKCIDFGCGHGNFAQALVRKGASYVYGIDFGKDSIDYATKARNKLGVASDKIEFKKTSVYNVPQEDKSFDFAIQNGVFHHLKDEEAAIREVYRVLKPGGYFWFYTDGSGAISHDLWDASIYILKDIPHEFTIDVLDKLNLSTGKRYHLGDSLNAVYKHKTWKELTNLLEGHGFGNFRRLVGGYDTDFDHDVISQDKYGKEKFGEGDLRLLTQKVG